jgi:hypothetical protein
MVASCTWLQTPILAGLLHRTICPILRALPSPVAHPLFPPLPTNTSNTLQTDDINIPESSSVGHTYELDRHLVRLLR